MQIGRISFRGDVVDISKARNNRGGGNNTAKPKIEAAQDRFERSHPAIQGLDAKAAAQTTQKPAITENNPIYYARIFDRIESKIRINNREFRITPEEAAKEVIQILKEGKAIKALSTAYNRKQYKEVGSFLNAFDDLDITLQDSKLDNNTYLAIDMLAGPIRQIAEDIDSQGILIEEDDDDESFADKVSYFILENIIKIEEKGTEAQKAENWEILENVIRLGHQVEEFPTFNFSVPSTPNINPETWTRTFDKIMQIIGKVRQETPCNPDNYIPEGTE